LLALLPVTYAVLLLPTLQLFRFTGGLATVRIDALTSDTTMIVTYRSVPVKWQEVIPTILATFSY
jgi:hypothetical protein